ncbi:MAG TPA: hypothetical protein VMW46_12480, partial [Candidatus Desulfaltia sp.]|nr:hypothetical protein [Candidatus Desulfaltia sp.]
FLFALGFLFSSLASPSTSPEEAKPSPVPAQISRFYDGYSFVSSFSTKQERSQLMACLKGQKFPSQPGYTRLKKILDKMQELQVQVQSIDPKIVVPPSPIVYIDYSGIVEVKSVSVLNDKATVDVTIHGLEPEASTWLISQYDQSGGDEEKLPSPEKRLELAKASTFRRAEIHVWSKFKSGWRKSEVNLILLKN